MVHIQLNSSRHINKCTLGFTHIDANHHSFPSVLTKRFDSACTTCSRYRRLRVGWVAECKQETDRPLGRCVGQLVDVVLIVHTTIALSLNWDLSTATLCKCTEDLSMPNGGTKGLQAGVKKRET